MTRLLGLSTAESLRTWTVLETVIGVAGLAFILIAQSLIRLVG